MFTFVLISLQQAQASQEWDGGEKTLFASWLAVHIVDWGQTRTISVDPNYYEMNPALGPYPSTGQVNNYFIGTALLNYLIVDALPKSMRKGWMTTNIVTSFGAVAHNNYIGINISF